MDIYTTIGTNGDRTLVSANFQLRRTVNEVFQPISRYFSNPDSVYSTIDFDGLSKVLIHFFPKEIRETPFVHVPDTDFIQHPRMSQSGNQLAITDGDRIISIHLDGAHPDFHERCLPYFKKQNA